MADEAVKTEQAAKKKKVNRLSLNDINNKIEELNKASHTRSKYYQHLLVRKNELQPSI